jgi:hypothetical protein
LPDRETGANACTRAAAHERLSLSLPFAPAAFQQSVADLSSVFQNEEAQDRDQEEIQRVSEAGSRDLAELGEHAYECAAMVVKIRQVDADRHVERAPRAKFLLKPLLPDLIGYRFVFVAQRRLNQKNERTNRNKDREERESDGWRAALP